MIVMKFGGASVVNTSHILKACGIVKQYLMKDRIILVVSAMRGITDQLYAVVELTKKKKLADAFEIIQSIKTKHLKTLYEINKTKLAAKTGSRLIHLISRLETFIHYNSHSKMTHAKIDFITSVGERLSCHLLVDALEINSIPACSIDTSYIIATDENFGDASPLPEKKQKYIHDVLYPLIKSNIVPVLSGFIGFAPDGRITTLGRGGSDLSATLIANILMAKGVYLWKDVPGFYTSDPHRDTRAQFMKKLTFAQAEKLAKKGAKVIYYKAIRPAAEKDIPIYIKSFLQPNSTGTIISGKHG